MYIYIYIHTNSNNNNNNSSSNDNNERHALFTGGLRAPPVPGRLAPPRQAVIYRNIGYNIGY